MDLCDKYTKLQVRTNADTPHDAQVARDFGAKGIGLTRTELQIKDLAIQGFADMHIGADPGMAGGDPSALNEVIAKARAAFEQGSASDSEVEALIAELTTALAEFNAQDHSPVGIVDGGYYSWWNLFLQQDAETGRSGNQYQAGKCCGIVSGCFGP